MSPEEKKRLLESVNGLLNFSSERTGLPVRHQVQSRLVDRPEVKKKIEENLQDLEKAMRLERSTLVLKKLGLVPRDYDIRKAALEATEDQLAGYYDPRTKSVSVLSWLPSRKQYAVLSHELTHALQDQAVELESWAKAPTPAGQAGLTEPDREEQVMARRAVAEGQATAIELEYILAPLGQTLANLPTIKGSTLHEIMRRYTPPSLLRAPRYVRESVAFPYTYGLAFIQEVLVKQGKERAFAGVLRNPPAHTHEVMHPAAYLAGEKVPPMAVPPLESILGEAFQRLDSGSFGEFDVLLFAQQYASEERASEISPHWRGGYYYVAAPSHKAPGGQAPPPGQAASGAPPEALNTVPGGMTRPVSLFFLSRWASPAAARKFAGIYLASLPLRYPGAAPQPAGKPSAPGDQSQAWDTSDGPVFVETRGAQLLVMESFDNPAAAKLRSATFMKPN